MCLVIHSKFTAHVWSALFITGTSVRLPGKGLFLHMDLTVSCTESDQGVCVCVCAEPRNSNCTYTQTHTHRGFYTSGIQLQPRQQTVTKEGLVLEMATFVCLNGHYRPIWQPHSDFLLFCIHKLPAWEFNSWWGKYIYVGTSFGPHDLADVESILFIFYISVWLGSYYIFHVWRPESPLC